MIAALAPPKLSGGKEPRQHPLNLRDSQEIKSWLVWLNPSSSSIQPLPGILNGNDKLLKVWKHSHLYHQMAPLTTTLANG